MQSTSAEAQRSIEPLTSELRQRVYSCIYIHGGATDQEIQIDLGMNPSTERPRRGELVTAGLIVDSGLRRATTSGRNAIVWVVKP